MNPTLFAIAGSPAAGKTSFIREKLREGLFPKDAFIHDCDAVMHSLEGYQKDLALYGSIKAFENWEIPARERAEAQLLEAIRKRQNIIYDRSCALPSSYAFLKDLVENHGYTLILHLLHIDREEAFSRAEKREIETGRHIPKAILSERMEGIRSLWPSYLKLASVSFLYDNSDFSRPLIARGNGAELTILDELAYRNFMVLNRSR